MSDKGSRKRSESESSSGSSSSGSSGSSSSSSSPGKASGSEAYSSDEEQESRFKVHSIVKKPNTSKKSDSRRSRSPDEEEPISRRQAGRESAASDDEGRHALRSGDKSSSVRERDESSDAEQQCRKSRRREKREDRDRDTEPQGDRQKGRQRPDDSDDTEDRRRDRQRQNDRGGEGDGHGKRGRYRNDDRRRERRRGDSRDRSPRIDRARDGGRFDERDRRGRNGYDSRESRRDWGRDRQDRQTRADTRYDRDLAEYRNQQNERRERERRERHKKRDEEESVKENNEAAEPPRDSLEKKRKNEDREDATEKTSAEEAPPVKKAKPDNELITTKTGGAYIPPARLRMMQQQISDKNSAAYQRIAWEALKKSINGLINKVNVSNLINIVQELFQENLVRGRGLLARSIIQAQTASLTFTHVYAALVAIINSKFPQNGELILKRLIINFRKGYKRNDKAQCLAATRFIAHLVNQQVAHEVLALEILTLLLENTTDDSVEVAIAFLKECGQKLTEVSPRGIHAIYERLRSILHEGQIDKRVQYMIEVIFTVRKDGFKDHPAVIEELDRVEEEDQFTHLVTLDEATDQETILDIFKVDTEYEANEEKYKVLRKEILDEGSSDEESGSGSGSDSNDEDTDEEGEEAQQKIIDQTETNLVALRRIIYLTIQSSLDFEECAHKLLKMELQPGQEVELCNMILDCCAQQRTYEKFFGLLAQRFCQLDKKYVQPFEAMFQEQYETIHRLETNKLRNVGKIFAHLLHTDAISWGVLQVIKLNEEDTTSSSRIFIKILFQELSEYMGLPKLNNRLKDETLQVYFEGLFPRDNPRNCRFAINFFTSIGLGGLTDELRAHLKSMPKQSAATQPPPAAESSSSASDSSSDSSSDSDDSSSDSSSSSSDSDSSSDSEEKENRASKRVKENRSTKESKQDSQRKQRDVRDERSPERTRKIRSEKSERTDIRSDKLDKRAHRSNGSDKSDSRTNRVDRSDRTEINGRDRATRRDYPINDRHSYDSRNVKNHKLDHDEEGYHGKRKDRYRDNSDQSYDNDRSERTRSYKEREDRENSSHRREDRDRRQRRR